MMRLLSRLAGGADAQIAALQAAMPKAAQSTPPGVGVDGAKGSDSTAYALADHTHASSVQRQKLTLGAGGGTITWTFAKPYAVPPIVTATVENAAGALQPYVVNLAGPATKESVTFAVFKAQPTTLGATLLAIANTFISPFVAAPAGVVVNCWAALPTA